MEVRIHLEVVSAVRRRGGGRVSGVLFLPLADFALAVEVPDRLGERPHDVRPLVLQDVVDVVHARDVTFAPLERAMDAQQADDVARVRVEELSCVRAVDAHTMDLRWVVSEILQPSISGTPQNRLSPSLPGLTWTCPRIWPFPFWLTKYPRYV